MNCLYATSLLQVALHFSPTITARCAAAGVHAQALPFTIIKPITKLQSQP
jgi:hypothetical protein